MTLYTEAEAAKRWCPFYRVSVAMSDERGAEWATNRDSAADCHVDVHKNCIGSKCMAWRVAGLRFDRYPDGTVVTHSSSGDPSRGYCGAFGKVEP